MSYDPKGVQFEPGFWEDAMEKVGMIRIEVRIIREC